MIFSELIYWIIPSVQDISDIFPDFKICLQFQLHL